MYATLWMTAWYKMMGVGLTWNTEVSTKINYFDLVTIGDSSFIADDGKIGLDWSNETINFGNLILYHYILIYSLPHVAMPRPSNIINSPRPRLSLPKTPCTTPTHPSLLPHSRARRGRYFPRLANPRSSHSPATRLLRKRLRSALRLDTRCRRLARRQVHHAEE